jgi:hypothetical protein
MPDVFGALGILAAALMLCFPDRLSRPQSVGGVLLVMTAILVHTSNLAVILALSMIAVTACRLLPIPRIPLRGLGLVSLAAVLAIATAAASDAGAREIFGEPVRTAPFLEGRVLADGPGRLFLQEACAERHFAACIYKDIKVAYPDEIIWPDMSRGLPLITDPAERRRFLDEQPEVVLGTILTHPFAELRAALANGLRQIADFRISNSMGASLRGMLELGNDRTMRIHQIVPNLASCLSQQPEPCDYERSLRYIQLLHYGVVVLAFLVLGWRAARLVAGGAMRPQSSDWQRPAIFALILVGGVIANGLICGALSGPWQRYQARVIWLIPMAAGLLEMRSLLGRQQPRLGQALAPGALAIGGDRGQP